jgi:hypothetical protein
MLLSTLVNDVVLFLLWQKWRGRLWHCVDSTGVGDDQYQETRGIACSGGQRRKNTRLTPGMLWVIPILAGSADRTGRPPEARRRPDRRRAAGHIVDGFAFSAGGFRHGTHFAGISPLISSCARVIGSPTLWHSAATVSISSTGAFSSTSCVSVPNATFSP